MLAFLSPLLGQTYCLLLSFPVRVVSLARPIIVFSCISRCLYYFLSILPSSISFLCCLSLIFYLSIFALYINFSVSCISVAFYNIFSVSSSSVALFIFPFLCLSSSAQRLFYILSLFSYISTPSHICLPLFFPPTHFLLVLSFIFNLFPTFMPSFPPSAVHSYFLHPSHPFS